MNRLFRWPRWKFPAVIAVLGWASVAGLAEEKWVSLYNGRDLTGWVQRGGEARYQAEGPDIVGSSVPKTANSFLCTDRSFTNFVLELEFRVATNLNSGIQIRSEHATEPLELKLDGKSIRIPRGRVYGYQVEIDPSVRSWTGGLYDEGRRGWLQDLTQNAAARKAFRLGDWNKFRIEARGPSIRTWLNGVPAADVKDELTPAGFIALQVHGVGDRREPVSVRWRNLRIQELP